MKLWQQIASLSLGAILVLTGASRAETKVELKGVHLCCPACVKAVGTTLKKVDGVKGECNRESKTVTITAKDDATARKAIDALAQAGFHGEASNKDFAIKDDSGAAKGKVKSITADKKEFTVTDNNGKDWNFTLSADAKIRLGDKEVQLNDMKRGDEVTVTYEKKGDQLIATRIQCKRD